jgi:thymidylate kinase
VADFWVLLGTDYCGKSAVLNELQARDGDGDVVPVSYDSDLVTDDEYRALTPLPEVAARAFAGGHSPEYILSLINVGVAYHRDRVFRAPPGRALLIDSYYYKFLAKCRLFGLADWPWPQYWRSLPQPAGVVFLDVDPATAWRRAGEGAQLNPLEHYGPAPDERTFTRFQRDLRGELLASVRHLRVEHVATGQDGQDVAATTDHVLRAIKE